MPYTTTEQARRQLFTPDGTVTDVSLVQDAQRRRAHGGVDMPNVAEGLAAQQGLVGATLEGQRITVQRDTDYERYRDVMRHRAVERQTQVQHACEQLHQLQTQLATTRKPRWGATRLAAVADLLQIGREDLLPCWWEHEPLDVTQARVEAALANLDTALAYIQTELVRLNGQ
jgi:hypothetical protein